MGAHWRHTISSRERSPSVGLLRLPLRARNLRPQPFQLLLQLCAAGAGLQRRVRPLRPQEAVLEVPTLLVQAYLWLGV